MEKVIVRFDGPISTVRTEEGETVTYTMGSDKKVYQYDPLKETWVPMQAH